MNITEDVKVVGMEHLRVAGDGRLAVRMAFGPGVFADLLVYENLDVASVRRATTERAESTGRTAMVFTRVLVRDTRLSGAVATEGKIGDVHECLNGENVL